jgi:hypothetical protein
MVEIGFTSVKSSWSPVTVCHRDLLGILLSVLYVRSLLLGKVCNDESKGKMYSSAVNFIRDKNKHDFRPEAARTSTWIKQPFISPQQ